MSRVYIKKASATPLPRQNIGKSICAICEISRFNFLQNAEFLKSLQKLFLFRSAVSGLAVTLPNMVRVTGGECA